MANLVVKQSNELIDPQAQLLVAFLKEMGLPSENIIADQSQRKIIGDNLQSLIGNIPHAVKKGRALSIQICSRSCIRLV